MPQLCEQFLFVLNTHFPPWSLELCPTMQAEGAWVTIPHKKTFRCWVSNGFLEQEDCTHIIAFFIVRERSMLKCLTLPPWKRERISKPMHGFLQCFFSLWFSYVALLCHCSKPESCMNLSTLSGLGDFFWWGGGLIFCNFFFFFAYVESSLSDQLSWKGEPHCSWEEVTFSWRHISWVFYYLQRKIHRIDWGEKNHLSFFILASGRGSEICLYELLKYVSTG